MNVKFDITNICNYDVFCVLLEDDGSCAFPEGTGFAYCYGEKYGTCECPLRENMI